MNKIKKMVCTLFVVGFFTNSAFATEINWYAKGLKAEMSGNTLQAIDYYKKSNLQDAKFSLGRIYRDTYADAENSFKWFLSSAQQGSTYAQYELGLMFLNGSSAVEQNNSKAKRWFLSAANRKHGKSAYQLFKLSNNNEQKERWLKIAADRGIKEAVQTLELAYRDGNFGIKADDKKSKELQNRLKHIQEQ